MSMTIFRTDIKVLLPMHNAIETDFASGRALTTNMLVLKDALPSSKLATASETIASDYGKTGERYPASVSSRCRIN